jgi:hypothetical protein
MIKAIRSVMLFVMTFALIATVAAVRDVYANIGWIAITIGISAITFAAGWRARYHAARKHMRANMSYGTYDIRSAYPTAFQPPLYYPTEHDNPGKDS